MARVGVALHEMGAPAQVAAIELADRLGVSTAWLTTGGVGPDAMCIFAAAAVKTTRIGLGTAIVPSYPRHPLVTAQQAITIASLAPGRFRLGVGPSHRPAIEEIFGLSYAHPLAHLREYVEILKAALQVGRFDFQGQEYRVKGEVPNPPNVPVLVSALRPASFRLAGELSDGALAWICPLPYLRDVAMPALEEGAAKAGRARPPLVAHCFVAVHDDRDAVRESARGRLAMYARAVNYQEMFAAAGLAEARQGAFSDAMLDAVVIGGDEAAVAGQLRAYETAGMDEVIASVLIVGDDRKSSMERTMRLVASL
jgi:F420-dependent oxidoreductase-like protein